MSSSKFLLLLPSAPSSSSPASTATTNMNKRKGFPKLANQLLTQRSLVRRRFSSQRSSSIIVSRPFLICLMTFLAALTLQYSSVQAMWLFQQQQQTSSLNNQSAAGVQTQQQKELATQLEQQLQQEKTTQSQVLSAASKSSGAAGGAGSGGYGSYGSGLFNIAGIQPSSISLLLNTVGDTGFRYFNIHDQCRNRAACDLGAMLYKKLSFIHNWLIRTSVRSLADMNNIYMQSWMEGMLGRNCTSVYATCRQSPLEGLMNLAMLQNLVY